MADIYISRNQIDHINKRHGKELEQVGLSWDIYVQTILDNFNQIRQGSGKSILLVIYKEGDTAHNTAAISMNYSLEKGFWELKTAEPRSTKDIEKRKKIW